MSSLRVLACSLAVLCSSALARIECPATSPPVRDVASVNIYGERGLRANIDRLRSREREFLMKPINEFMQQTATQATSYVDRGDRAAARCAVGALRSWAVGEALLGGLTNEAANKEVIWNTAGLALAYLRVKAQALPAERADIEVWLTALARRVTSRYGGVAGQNNVFSWVGLVAAAVAAATDDQVLWQESERIHEAALRTIDAQGILPIELQRGRRALAYHNFALVPLMVTGELRRRAGREVSASGTEALERLVRFTGAMMKDSSLLADLAGSTQDDPGTRNYGVWSYIALVRFPGVKIDMRVGPEPPFDRWLGGNARFFIEDANGSDPGNSSRLLK